MTRYRPCLGIACLNAGSAACSVTAAPVASTLVISMRGRSRSAVDLGAVRFLLLRSPLASYLHGHPLELERWPAALLDQYHAQLIPEMTCLCAWKEPLLPVRETLIRGVDHVLDEYALTSHQLVECHRSLRAIQHRHWQI